MYGAVTQLGECLPCKQEVGSSSLLGSIIQVAGVAQLVAQLICNHQVVGSSPTISLAG